VDALVVSVVTVDRPGLKRSELEREKEYPQRLQVQRHRCGKI